MAICKRCGRQFIYDDEQGYARDICGPLCDGMLSRQPEIDRLTRVIEEVTDLIDDVLYVPTFHPVDETGNPITGDARYLADGPIMHEHLPALRAWFVGQCKAVEAEGGE